MNASQACQDLLVALAFEEPATVAEAKALCAIGDWSFSITSRLCWPAITGMRVAPAETWYLLHLIELRGADGERVVVKQRQSWHECRDVAGEIDMEAWLDELLDGQVEHFTAPTVSKAADEPSWTWEQVHDMFCPPDPEIDE